jgi:cephalosporin hydroxylase
MSDLTLPGDVANMAALPMNDPLVLFSEERLQARSALVADREATDLGIRWMNRVNPLKYPYQFDWLGRPVIQYPQDMVALQELVWQVRPTLIVETGIAHGGSLVLAASLLAMGELCDAAREGIVVDPSRPLGRVLGIDIDIRAHNRQLIEAHPLAGRIEMIEGSSVDPKVVSAVRHRAAGEPRVLVSLDSNHTHEHVLAELEAYAGLVTTGSYLIACDTVIADLDPRQFPDRPWGRADNPRTAVEAFLATHPEFEIDRGFDKFLVGSNPGGYLRRIA